MDPWQMLGIDATASYEEANTAYRVRIQLRHPDRHQGASKPVLDEAARETRELNEAWELVKVRIRERNCQRQNPIAEPDGQSDGEVLTKQVAEEPVRASQKAQSDQESRTAHRMELEVAQKQLELNRAYLDRALSEGGSIRISRLREAIALSEKMVIAAELAVRANGSGSEARQPDRAET